MVNEIFPDYAAEAFYQSLIPEDVFSESEKPDQNSNCCIVVGRRLGPNVVSIRSGVAIIHEQENAAGQDDRIMSCSARTIFMFK